MGGSALKGVGALLWGRAYIIAAPRDAHMVPMTP